MRRFWGKNGDSRVLSHKRLILLSFVCAVAGRVSRERKFPEILKIRQGEVSKQKFGEVMARPSRVEPLNSFRLDCAAPGRLAAALGWPLAAVVAPAKKDSRRFGSAAHGPRRGSVADQDGRRLFAREREAAPERQDQPSQRRSRLLARVREGWLIWASPAGVSRCRPNRVSNTWFLTYEARSAKHLGLKRDRGRFP